MKKLITFTLACSIGLLVGYFCFGPGNHNKVIEAVSRGVEAVHENAQRMIPAGSPDNQAQLAKVPALKKESKDSQPLKKVVPSLPEKTEAPLEELSGRKDSPPTQDNPVNQEAADWKAKDIDIIFKILNGAQDRLQGKVVVAPQKDDPKAGGTEEIPDRKAPSATLNKKQTSQAPMDIKGKITHYARQFGVKESFLMALIRVESNFDPNAVSHKGAIGLMQVMPGTGSIYGVHKKDLMNPDINIRTGLAYFKDMHSYFQNNEEMALAAYNCGPSRVLENKIPMETRIYIRDVKNMERYYARFFI